MAFANRQVAVTGASGGIGRLAPRRRLRPGGVADLASQNLPAQKNGKVWGYHARPFSSKPGFYESRRVCGGPAPPTSAVQRLSGRHGHASACSSGTVDADGNRGSHQSGSDGDERDQPSGHAACDNRVDNCRMWLRHG
jgi:hypothetical protein